MFTIESIKKSKFTLYKELLVEHWGILIFIPAILGGFLQLFKLVEMDFSYVRFFAVEQVVPDGLLVLFLILSGSIVIGSVLSGNFKIKKIRLGWNFKNLFIFTLASLIVLTPIFIGIAIGISSEGLTASLITFICKIVITIAIFFYLVSLRYLYCFRNKIHQDEITDSDYLNFIEDMQFPKFHYFISYFILGFFVFIYCIVIPLKSIYKEANNFRNIKNEEIYLNKVKTDLNIKEDLAIEYFNGKYIFLKLTGVRGETKYLVLKGEGFTNLLKEK
ncbi:hypothetical protein [Acinetobacter sp. ANC 3882]|uniref:hypothetical protein n=1 Tax=Acinetobacter sp. ANC 3882 TaxID=2923423 RepID=UPI001F4A30BF|nr:hypothetical protein [Acinetobacter sp. ANC 3882]MCH7313407.1 hypothetical protein [Acinetobacter sp. ANC 3882]